MKKAFTLSEVLITVGIIGVVAAMTVPTLMQNYQKQSYITQLKKSFSELSQVAESAMADSNSPRLMETKAVRAGTDNFLQTYFKTTQICDAANGVDCFASEYTTLNGTAYRLRDLLSGTSSCAVLASGSSLCLANRSSFISAVVDVNGKQGPNILGRDLFSLYIQNDGTVTSPTSPSAASVEDCQTGDYGACLGVILKDGWVMDY